jgi:hypothetical protein
MVLKWQRFLGAFVLGFGLFLTVSRLLLPAAGTVHAAPDDVYCVVPAGSSTGPFAACTSVFTSVQVAVDAAAGGEEIRVAGGTYDKVQPNEVVLISQSLTIRGGYAAPFDQPADSISQPTTLQPSSTARVVHVLSGSNVITLENLILAGGSTDSQTGPHGGGILNEGSLILFGVVISGNAANVGEGGGIYNSGILTATGVSVGQNNTGGQFGRGGGIFNRGTLTLVDSTVLNNNVFESNGGGIFNSGTLAVIQSTIKGNTNFGFFGSGGGLTNSGTVMMRNSTVSGNAAASPGAGISNSGQLSLTYSTLSQNVVGGDLIGSNEGGGLQNNGVISAANTIIAGNSSISDTIADCLNNGTLTSLGYNLFGEGGGCPAGGSDLVISPSLVFSTVLGPLGDHGGQTETYNLLHGSPAIDAANPDDCLTVDQRGRARPVDGDLDGTARCDIGAFEAQLEYYLPIVNRE